QKEIGKNGASSLGSALAKCTNLSNFILNLDSSQIGHEGVIELSTGLAKCTNLLNLTLDL
ncbi:hypothetical protein ABPG74_006777, partial [Tetrahymena malaccensis]